MDGRGKGLRRAAGTGVRLAVLPCLLALAGCDPWVVGDGVFKEETRPVGPFTAVSVKDGITVEVQVGAAQRSLKVSGDENVLQHVKTVVKNEGSVPTLVVETDVAHMQSTLPLLVDVEAPTLTSVTATDASAVDVSGVAAESFAVMAGEGAAVTLAGAKGEALTASLWGGSGGGASLDARSYIVNSAVVNLSGGALAQLHVDELLTGTASEGSTVENVGEGACEVAASGGATVSCMAP